MSDKSMTPNIEISTVVGCRMGCDYCPQKLHVSNYKAERVMSMETFNTCLSKIPSSVEFMFAGMAEPFQNPNCTDMILATHKKGHRISIYSTLEGMTLEDLWAIKEIPFNHFCIHLPDADGVMKFRVTPQYLDVLQSCLGIIPGRNFMCIGKVHPEVERITGPVPDSSNTLISRAGNIKTLSITPKKGKLICSAMGPKLDHNVLLPNGDVLLCCMDYGQDHVLGNLLTMDYEGLFNSPEYHRIKEGLEDENSNILCRRCELAQER